MQIENLNEIISFETKRLADSGVSDEEVVFAQWQAPWREESLNHYLPLGWSFGLWQDKKLQGYFLAQPLLFARGFTQTLWVEHLSSIGEEPAMELMDVAYKLAREKHFQKLLVNKKADLKKISTSFALTEITDQVFEVNTSKIQ